MEKTQLIQYAIIGLFLMLVNCQRPDNSNINTRPDNPNGDKPRTFSPYMNMDNIFILQGNITKGTIRIIAEVAPSRIMSKMNYLFTEDASSGFNIKRHTTSRAYKSDDIYIGLIPIMYGSPSFNDDNLSELLQKYRVKTSTDFEGTMYMFLNFTSLFRRGNPSGSGDVSRTLVYGKKLADALKDRGIIHMDKAQTQPVGEKERVKIYGNADPDSIRKLMQAAKVVQDPRLLIIERESGTGKVNITVFGEKTPRTVTAGTTFLWEFGKEELEKLRQFVVKW